jgi:hypothetical protein
LNYNSLHCSFYLPLSTFGFFRSAVPFGLEFVKAHVLLRVCKTITDSRHQLALLGTNFHGVLSRITSTTTRLRDTRSKSQHNLHFSLHYEFQLFSTLQLPSFLPLSATTSFLSIVQHHESSILLTQSCSPQGLDSVVSAKARVIGNNTSLSQRGCWFRSSHTRPTLHFSDQTTSGSSLSTNLSSHPLQHFPSPTPTVPTTTKSHRLYCFIRNTNYYISVSPHLLPRKTKQILSSSVRQDSYTNRDFRITRQSNRKDAYELGCRCGC